MQKSEFTQRTDIQVSDVEYKEIELMYLEAGNMDKDELFFRQAENLKSKLDDMRDERNSLVDFLLDRAQCFGDVELLHKAIQMVGHDKVIKRKLRMDLPLWDEDKNYIVENIK